MKILVVTTHYYPDVAATGVIMRYLTEDLAKQGHSVTVITSLPHYDRGNTLLWGASAPKTERLQDGKLTIHRVHVYTPRRKTWVLGRALNFLSFALMTLLQGMRVDKHDVILALSPPLSNGLTADLIGRLKGTPFVLNLQDIWPDAVILAGVVRNPLLIAAARRFEKYVYRRARSIAVVSENLRKTLLSKGTRKGVRVIENFCDPNFLKPLPRHNEFSREHDLDNSFVVLFAGNIGYSQGIESIVHAADLLKERRNILFLIAGNGVMKSGIEAEVKRLRLSNVRFLPFQPHETLPLMYSSADLGVITLRKGFGACSEPSKVFSIMAMERPVLAAVEKETATWRVVSQAQCGICIEPEDAGSLACAIKELADNPEACHRFGRNGRSAVLKGHSRENAVVSYDDLFRSSVH